MSALSRWRAWRDAHREKMARLRVEQETAAAEARKRRAFEARRAHEERLARPEGPFGTGVGYDTLEKLERRERERRNAR